MTRCLGWFARGVAAGLVGLTVLTLAAPGGVTAAWAAPGPSAYPEYWFDQWGIPTLWAQGDRGGGITIAVVDTGVSTDPPELAGKVLAGTDLTGEGGDGRIDRDQDAFSHGTAMASIIAGDDGPVFSGVAPDSRILPIAVPLQDTTATVHSDRTSEAIDYAVDHGAKVINMSFGADRDPAEDSVACPDAVQNSVFRALSKGAILVASAGNAGQKGSPVEDPSVCIGVVSVAAVDAEGNRAPFSSIHRYNTVAAPGVNVVSAGRNAGDYFVGAGTSQAAALTSGALALIWSAHRAETNEQILDRLFAGLHPAGPAGRDRYYGDGIVDAGASVTATLTSTSTDPVWAAAAPFLDHRAATRGPAITPPAPVSARALTARAARDAPPGPVTPTSRLGLAILAAGLLFVALLLYGRRLLRRRPEPAPVPVYVPPPSTWWTPPVPSATPGPPADHRTDPPPGPGSGSPVW